MTREHNSKPVSAFVKATVQDAPYIVAMVPHMLRQAGYDFQERFLVVDWRRSFSGKFRDRTTPEPKTLEKELEKLLDTSVIDHVVEVDYDRQTLERVMTAYFGSAGADTPTHDRNGGAIYPTLFGLEHAASNLVVQFDADMFFHASDGSWVARALEHMDRDKSLWLMMTHGGPPAGPLGHPASLGRRNRCRAHWDEELKLWRFRTVSTRYFLCDRRNFRGQLDSGESPRTCQPLERCMSRAIQRAGAWRGTIAIPGSWDLHAYNHEQPFPRWALALVEAVERGTVPELQRGSYDLRLNRPADRAAWQALLSNDGKTPGYRR